jgi:glycine cleavage system aminomethyltransferase T
LVMDGDAVVGRVTAGVPSPTLGLGVGYVVFKSPGNWVDRKLSMYLPDGSTHESHIVDLPFFDREKNIVRGVDKTIPERPIT